MIKWFSCSSHQSVYIYCKIFISWSFDRYSRSLFGSELGRRKFIQSVQKLRSFQVKTKEITAWKVFFFWSLFSYIWNELLFTLKTSVFNPNTGKYGPEKTPYLNTFHAVNMGRYILHSDCLQAFRATTLLKRSSNTGPLLWILQKIFKNTYFEEHLRTTASLCWMRSMKFILYSQRRCKNAYVKIHIRTL